jgi:hypothetical protein
MFQYAAGRSVAAARGVELLLAVGALSSSRRGRTPRAYELGGCRIRAAICDAQQEREIALAGRLGRCSRLLTRWAVYKERGHRFDPSLFTVPSGTVLQGYWQSERYFKQERNALANELSPVQRLPALLESWRREMASSPSVSVHVRRGDYVALPSAASFHGALPLAYYRRAIERIRQVEPSPVCYVFTDDPAWCRSNLVLDGCKVHHVSAELASNSIQDLALMRSCRHHIIANSSFSWWGAWLAGADTPGGGVVVAPRRWFADATDTAAVADRFPSHWELL